MTNKMWEREEQKLTPTSNGGRKLICLSFFGGLEFDLFCGSFSVFRYYLDHEVQIESKIYYGFTYIKIFGYSKQLWYHKP